MAENHQNGNEVLRNMHSFDEVKYRAEKIKLTASARRSFDQVETDVRNCGGNLSDHTGSNNSAENDETKALGENENEGLLSRQGSKVLRKISCAVTNIYDQGLSSLFTHTHNTVDNNVDNNDTEESSSDCVEETAEKSVGVSDSTEEGVKGQSRQRSPVQHVSVSRTSSRKFSTEDHEDIIESMKESFTDAEITKLFNSHRPGKTFILSPSKAQAEVLPTKPKAEISPSSSKPRAERKRVVFQEDHRNIAALTIHTNDNNEHLTESKVSLPEAKESLAERKESLTNNNDIPKPDTTSTTLNVDNSTRRHNLAKSKSSSRKRGPICIVRRRDSVPQYFRVNDVALHETLCEEHSVNEFNKHLPTSDVLRYITHMQTRRNAIAMESNTSKCDSVYKSNCVVKENDRLPELRGFCDSDLFIGGSGGGGDGGGGNSNNNGEDIGIGRAGENRSGYGGNRSDYRNGHGSNGNGVAGGHAVHVFPASNGQVTFMMSLVRKMKTRRNALIEADVVRRRNEDGGLFRGLFCLIPITCDLHTDDSDKYNIKLTNDYLWPSYK